MEDLTGTAYSYGALGQMPCYTVRVFPQEVVATSYGPVAWPTKHAEFDKGHVGRYRTPRKARFLRLFGRSNRNRTKRDRDLAREPGRRFLGGVFRSQSGPVYYSPGTYLQPVGARPTTRKLTAGIRDPIGSWMILRNKARKVYARWK